MVSLMGPVSNRVAEWGRGVFLLGVATSLTGIFQKYCFAEALSNEPRRGASSPTLTNPVSDQYAAIGQSYSLDLNVRDVFSDSDAGDSLTLTATLADGSPLPNWLTFQIDGRELGSLETDWALDVAYHPDGYAFIADNDWGLKLIDVSDKENPTLEVNWSPNYVKSVHVEGDSLYVICIGCLPNSESFRIMDISNLPSGVVIGASDKNGRELTKVGDRMYTGYDIIGIGTPSSPQKVGEIDSNDIQDIEVDNFYAFLASGNSGFKVFDVSNPAATTELFSRNIGGDGNDVAIELRGNLAYLGTWNDLYVYDISVPSSPTELGVTPIDTDQGETSSMVVIGDYAFIGTNSGLKVVDINDSSNPIYKNKLFAGYDIRDINMYDTYAYAAVKHDGLLVADLAQYSFSGFPGFADEGTVSIKLTAKDNDGNSAEDIFDLTVSTEVPSDPTPSSDSTEEGSESDPTSTLESIYSNRTYQVIGGVVGSAIVLGGGFLYCRGKRRQSDDRSSGTELY